jgi:release factor glutamine methyltransferase
LRSLKLAGSVGHCYPVRVSLTLVSLWTEVRQRLEAAGVDAPVLDARLLVEAGAGVSRLDIVTDPRRALTPQQIEAVNALARRRERREPIAHILGRKQFWKHDFTVSCDVLVPRPETELLVEAALEALPMRGPARVLDLGVGSGAILLSVLHERVDAHGVGVDASAAALEVARANAEALGLSSRTDFRQGDWTQGLAGAFDVIVSNPPYIAAADIETLEPEVAEYEPRLALDGGADGLDAYRAITAGAPRLLAPGGLLALEVGQDQQEAVTGLIRAAGILCLPVRLDLAGAPRVVAGRAPG